MGPNRRAVRRQRLRARRRAAQPGIPEPEDLRAGRRSLPWIVEGEKPLCACFAEPSHGLEPSTPSYHALLPATDRNPRQRFWLVFAAFFAPIDLPLIASPVSALSTLDHARLAASGRAGQPAHLRGARDAPAPARRHPGGTLWVDFAVLAAFSARSRQRQPGRTRARFSERAAGGRTETQRLPRPCRRRRVSAPSSPSGYFE